MRLKSFIWNVITTAAQRKTTRMAALYRYVFHVSIPKEEMGPSKMHTKLAKFQKGVHQMGQQVYSLHAKGWTMKVV